MAAQRAPGGGLTGHHEAASDCLEGLAHDPVQRIPGSGRSVAAEPGEADRAGQRVAGRGHQLGPGRRSSSERVKGSINGAPARKTLPA